MSRPAAFRCATAARDRHDDPAGTAARAHGWVLVEHPGPWPFGGFAELPLPGDVIGEVRQAALAAGLRILLIRRHGRRPRPPEFAWAVLRYDADGRHRQQWGSWSDPSGLRGIVAAIDRAGTVGLPPVYLVCTHGIHDACCAIRGRPVATALAAEWPDHTWECSHVGGDRYAGNLLVAPDGIYFGEVTATTAPAAVRQLRDGLVAADHLRGYCDLSAPAQYAVVVVLRRWGPAGRHAIQVTSARRDRDRWTVTLECAAPLPARVTAVVRSFAQPAARLTCLAPTETRGVAWETVSLTSH
ncbi:sucrase ferredoxin [Flexivirga sp.]|uniref:sucrase ferredoxin n=1 Tax=Flexivirga sp. TaxID=1962927 RepID=UPI003F7FC45D